MKYESEEEYVRQQTKWIAQCKVRDGDKFVVIVEVSLDWPVGSGNFRILPGDIVTASEHECLHDRNGITVYKTGTAYYDEPFGIPFWALSKLEE